MPDLDTLLRPPYIYLIIGVGSIFMGVLSMFIGKVAGRGVLACRATKPVQFWCGVAMYFLGGICFIGYFLYKVHGLLR